MPSEETGMDRTVVIYGSSDDLIEVDGKVPGCDEYNGERASFVVTGGTGQQTRVDVRYDENGCWAIELAPVDDEIPMLGATIDVAPMGYSARATFENVRNVIPRAH